MSELMFLKTDSSHPDFRELEPLLDAELRILDGEDADFYAQFNKSKIIDLNKILIGYLDGKAVACGAVKSYDAETAEIKRMYVREEFRSQGIAAKILEQLENWARTLGYKYSILETGKRQEHAIALYKKSGYEVIPNYGQYIGVDNSVCMRKSL